MRAQRFVALCAALTIAGVAVPSGHAAAPPTTWDGLVQVKSKRLDAVYLLPDADFRPYTKVMLDPTEVAFKKNWLRDYNNSTIGVTSRLSQKDVDRVKQEVSTGFGQIFAKAFQDAGYQVVQTPGPDVLRVRTGVVNLDVAAPDTMSPGRTRTYSEDAGEATLVLEARDSQTGALMGRALDRQLAGDTRMFLRNSMTNQSDFSNLFRRWAQASVDGLAKLKEASPLAAGASTAAR